MIALTRILLMNFKIIIGIAVIGIVLIMIVTQNILVKYIKHKNEEHYSIYIRLHSKKHSKRRKNHWTLTIQKSGITPHFKFRI